MKQYGIDGAKFYVNSASGQSMAKVDELLPAANLDGSIPVADIQQVGETIIGGPAARMALQDEYFTRYGKEITKRRAQQMLEGLAPDVWCEGVDSEGDPLVIPQYDVSSLDALVDGVKKGIADRARNLKQNQKATDGGGWSGTYYQGRKPAK